ncbi:MAG TPA: TetR/AcrR family transcriptional regulator [Anaerolineae bacterium]|nr:TetR/AcrR family transcriptional regulator [Anaerolineae bacterium]
MAKTVASTARDQIVEATCDLLEAQGYHATGLNQIVAESGAPKGSLYHYFPDGKEELAAAAIDRTGRALTSRVEAGLALHDDPAAAVQFLAAAIADAVEQSGFRAGGPLTTVAMETATSSERINLACRAAFDRLQAAFAGKLAAGGHSRQRAAELATFITAAIEGGIILSRTYHTGDPLRRVGQELAALLR